MTFRKRKRKVLVSIGLFLLISAVAVVFIADAVVRKAGNGKLYNDVSTIPFNKVGLLLGTGKYIEDRYLNPYYEYRIHASEELLKSGKIKYLIICD